MSKYDKYKDTNIEWIGEIPEHWEVKKLKYLASVSPSNVDKKSLPGEVNVKLCNYLDVYRNDFIRADFDFMDATAKVSEIEKFSLCKGDILLTKDSETPDDIAIPALVDENMEGVLCGYHLTHIKPSSVVPGYLFWFIKSYFTRKYFETHAHGVTRYSINVYDTVSFNILLPPKEEQTQISSYLKDITILIDEAIKRAKGENNLLKEYRQSLISNVVTGKINVQDYQNN